MAEEDRLQKRKQMGLENRFVFLYLGTLSVWQWPEALFSVFSQFLETRPEGLLYLLLPESDHEVALSYCRKHRLAPDSYLLDEVPHERVGTVAGIADAGLLLRKAHPVNAVSSPTKFGEYLAAGLPTVATDTIGDTSNIIRSERVGLVVSAADDGLTPPELESLLCFAEDVRVHRSDWASRAAQAAEKHLGWTARVHTLIDNYRAMVEAPATGI